ncbi:OLC1v1019527C1 [Oldenlandia corymbosa var. corymbosa]|uniref:OLC1v1019527C1 n=1 Tax=Oldenlandia corymbosa var. corymbosa TaxID=529605 RepID=A0AAV1EE56_OLDCO|nr:OLC1v1019527C1 [Oldenlandia corymbosa var. corymbosa]
MFFSCRTLKLTQNVPPKSIFGVQFVSTLSNLKPFNSKLSNYMRNGLVEAAEIMFDEMPHRNTVTWNAMVRGYFQNGISDKAINFYNRMPVRDIFSYNTMISGLMHCGDVKGAEKVFECMGDRDVVTWNTMISGYVNHGMMDDAVRVFNEMPEKDVVSWNLVIAGLMKIKEVDLAEHYFKEITAPDVASWTIMIKGLLNVGRIVEARQYFDSMPVRDVQAWETMMVGYLDNGYIEIAEALFHKMPNKDSSCWNEIINGLVSAGKVTDAMKLFHEMPQKHERLWNLILLCLIRNGLVREAHAFLEKYCLSDAVAWTNVIIGYFELGEVKNSIKLFESMPIRDTTAWNATIFGLGENDLMEDGARLFIRMIQEGNKPDEATFTSVFVVCSSMASLNLGNQTHALAIKAGLDDFTPVGNAIINMYFRCGSMESAFFQFSVMSCHDIISWNSIICGSAYHGKAEKSLAMFENMRLTDVKANQVTFVGVLSACSHAGLVEQGKSYFHAMKNDYSLLPLAEHYTCVVDLLGRFGLIDDALHILDQMKADGFEVPASVWGALLGACRMHKNLKVGEVAGERMLELEPSNSGMYMMLAEMFLSDGRRRDAEKMWVRMKDEGVKKQPGCSWIESKNSSHIFLSGDRTHPECFRIACVLELLYSEMGARTSTLGDSSFFDFEVS